jgi:hypothetical protein
MSKKLTLSIVLAGLFLLAGSAWAESSISMGISGPGAVNDSTIKAGKNVFIDIYTVNDKERTGVSFGFEISSKDIDTIIHVADSGNGVNVTGDVKGYNGWEGKKIFDVTGVMAPEHGWDGVLPDLIGFAGAVAKMRYEPHKKMKVLSMELIVPKPGTLTIDSAFFPPGGTWKWVPGNMAEEGEPQYDRPTWMGPYSWKVIE